MVKSGCLGKLLRLKASIFKNKNKFEWTQKKIIFFWSFEVSALLDVRHCLKLKSCVISRKTNDATLRKSQKPSFRTQFGAPMFFSWVLSLLLFMQCSKVSSYVISRKTNDPNLKKWQKLNFGPDFGLFGTNLSPQIL